MSFNINEYMDELNVRNKKIDSINMEMRNRTEEHEKIMHRLNEQFLCQSKYVQELKDMVISVNLKDLIDELSWLSGINKDKIKMEMKFNMLFSNIDEFFKFIDDINGREIKNARLRLWTDTEEVYNKFDYFMFLSMNTNLICRDGKRLIEHFSVLFDPFSCSDELSGVFSANNNFESILIYLNLGDIEHTDNTSWYPSDLFSQAVFNCVQRDYEHSVDKIRKKIKK